MRIGELAHEAGITAKTVRYYEGIGLMNEPPREASGYRRYGPTDLSRLRFIVAAKQMGLSLNEIHDVIDVSGPHAVSCGHVLAMLEARRDRIEEWMRRAEEVHAELVRTIQASKRRLRDSASPEDACPILEQGLHARVQLTLDAAPGRSS
ncbi:MAG: MerR family transcriptional regulator [Chloroflexota bacterium]